MNKSTYNKSVDILLDAYNNETLFHAKCDCCAVGNLLGGNVVWALEFCTTDRGQNRILDVTHHYYRHEKQLEDCSINIKEASRSEITEYVNQLCEINGYTTGELAQIEFAFENSIMEVAKEKSDGSEEEYEKIYEDLQESRKKEGQYIGLCAVLKCMETMVDEEIDSCSNLERLKTIAHEKYQVV